MSLELKFYIMLFAIHSRFRTWKQVRRYNKSY